MHWPFASKAEPWWPLRFLNSWPWHNRHKLNSQKEKNDSDHRTSLTVYWRHMFYWNSSLQLLREKECDELTSPSHGTQSHTFLHLPSLSSLSFQKAVLKCFFKPSRPSTSMPGRILPPQQGVLDVGCTIISETWPWIVLRGHYFLAKMPKWGVRWMKAFHLGDI